MSINYASKLIGIIFLLSLNSTCNAEIGLSLASGYGAAEILPVRVGLINKFDFDWRKNSSWPATGYIEAGYYYMKGRKGPIEHPNRELSAYTLAWSFRFIKRDSIYHRCWPYIDLGIGGSYLTKKHIGGRKLGINFQFEDRLGIGVRFGRNCRYDLGYRVVHFSNGYIGNDNHGINLHMMVLVLWL